MISISESLASILRPKPNYVDHSKGFVIRNYSTSFYFPTSSLAEGLEEVIIFPANEVKYGIRIPNGSVFTFSEGTNFKPEILKSDVGCGLTVFMIEKLEYNTNLINSLLNIINEEKIQIGRKNHFIDFCEGHPFKTDKDLIIVHSDFNLSRITPLNYDQAKDLEKIAEEKRICAIEKLVNKLGINGVFYKNWTHNSVNMENGKIIYRKGSINLNETNWEGVLSLHPYEGVYFYVGYMKDHQDSMQHALGKKNLEQTTKFGQEIHKKGKVEIMKIDRENIPENIYMEYNDVFDGFAKYFEFNQKRIGSSRPKLVISTS